MTAASGPGQGHEKGPHAGATSYDESPYRSRPCTESHPSRLHTIATLLGLKPPAVPSCRVLELACGDGSNLLSIAESLPAASCVGVDLAARHIADAKADAAKLGLGNVRFVQADILQLGKDDLGEFDYIIAHGLYSWVPRPVQERLLSLCKQHLSPGGVAFISYNVLPGWRVHSILRDFMLFHTRGVEATADRLRGAREALSLLEEFGQHDAGGMLKFVADYTAVFGNHLSSLGECADSLILYDSVSTYNTPVYFSQFAGHVEQHGLQYLAEADFQLPIPGVVPAEVLEKASSHVRSQVDLEQYIDFYRMRMFRQSLLCHGNLALSGAINAESMAKLYVSALAQPDGPLYPCDGEFAVFKSPKNRTLRTNHPLTKAALLHLIDVWPRAVPFQELCEAALARLRGRGKPTLDAAARSTATLGMNLISAFAHGPGLVFLHAFAPEVETTPSPRPLTRAVARLQAARGQEVTNVFHDNIGLPPLALQLVALLDGTRDLATLRSELRVLARRGVIDVSAYGRPGEAPGDGAIAEALTNNLQILRRMGLLLK